MYVAYGVTMVSTVGVASGVTTVPTVGVALV